jgi:hypothetical protein
MKARKWAAAAGILAVLSLLGWSFVTVIWIPLYGGSDSHPSFARPEEPLRAEMVKEDGTARSWSVADAQALAKLRDELRRADYSEKSPPRLDQKYRLRIRRPDSRVDDYEVLLDERGNEPDLLYVIRRSGGASIYGSALKTPELRAALQQVLKEPQTAPK